jgi:hypothetical protein
VPSNKNARKIFVPKCLFGPAACHLCVNPQRAAPATARLANVPYDDRPLGAVGRRYGTSGTLCWTATGLAKVLVIRYNRSPIHYQIVTPVSQRETMMNKHEEKTEQKSPAKPDSIAKDAELSEEQLNQVSAGSSSGAAKNTKVFLHVRKAGGDAPTEF